MEEKDGVENTEIHNYVVLPELTNASFEKIEANVAIKQLIDLIRQKTHESQKCVEATSAVSFMANNLQNRQLCTEFSVQVAKFFNDLEVTSETACNEKLEELGKSDEEIATLTNDLKSSWKEWESFLEELDKSIEQLAGPFSPKSISSTDNIKLANAKSKSGADQGTLLAYVQNSPYQMMFIEVVFSLNNCADHVMKIYEKHKDFQDQNCDIFYYGGGFLKLVGVPFRLLLDEEQSLARILQHRQSAVSLCGQRAITMLAEIGDEPEFVKSGLDKNGGALLMNHSGDILYNHSCKNPTDWPNVEDILKEVKKNKKDTPDQEKPVNGVSKSKDTNVEVGGKRRCCTIM
ncbi:hypothetical protein M3Y97_00605300 [Aphelenchoides bicaudatus]|nr:hypothetical protein M3Y97_00605300 [Aphelenchoides bicaudatus]